MYNVLGSVFLLLSLVVILLLMPRNPARIGWNPYFNVLSAWSRACRREWFLLDARRVARFRYLTISAKLEKHSGLSEQDLDLLAARMSSVAVRWSYRHYFERRVWMFFLAFDTAFTALCATVRSSKADPAQAGLAQWAVICLGLGLWCAAMYIRLTRMRLDAYLEPTFGDFIGTQSIFALGAVAGFGGAILDMVRIDSVPHRAGEGSGAYWTTGFYVFVMLMATTIIVACRELTRYRGRLEPLDAVMIRLFGIVIRMRELERQRGWASAGNIGRLTTELDKAARVAERATAWRAARWDPALQKEARVYGARLAAVIRLHKAPLVVAQGPADIARVRNSLTAGLLAWAHRDTNALVAAVPSLTLQSKILALGRRLAPALTLAVAAVALPLIPAIRGQAGQIHLTLGVLSAVSAVAGGVSPARPRPPRPQTFYRA
jgi:hypothetical protein